MLLAAMPLALAPLPAAAQNGVSRAVVQPLRPPAAEDLNAALRRLARNSQDFAALVDAGTASLELNDIEASIGFFGRADQLRAGDPRVKAGLAAAYLRADRPLEALQLFAEAERAGQIPIALAADRGLAHDLVGDNAAAQAQYRAALARGRNDEVVRRLALSQAIAGDRRGFEATLFPLLERRDLAAYRARAFGLAVLGEEAEAVAIVEAVMPREMADRVAAYLRFMPRLTRAQQAAAANLGHFPRAAQIGRDDPRLAQYGGRSSASPGRADSRLAPAGEPLGPRQASEDTRSQRRRPDRGSSTTERSRTTREARATQIAQAETARASGTPTRAIPPVVVRPEPATVRDPAPSAASPPPPPPPPPPAPSPPPPEPRPSISIDLPPAAAQSATSPAPGPGFDLARVGNGPAVDVQPALILPSPSETPTSQPVARTVTETVPPPGPASVADAFADLALAPAPPPTSATGAVDITAIKVRREAEQPPEPPKPAKPVHPSRRWVQVATGKDLKALAFDWRRFGRKAPDLLAKRTGFTTPWGESRRLLTGPFESDRAAQTFVTDLKAAGLDAFTFSSDEGQEIAPLR